MYSTVLILHSFFRWLVFFSLCYAIVRAYRGHLYNSAFSFWDNKVRHWTATIAHIQLILGILIFVKSPIIKYYLSNFKTSLSDWSLTFFGIFHPLMMIVAIIATTIGSAKAKRMKTDKQKFKTMFIWFSVALIIILAAIPWPFSPLANRPYLRTF